MNKNPYQSLFALLFIIPMTSYGMTSATVHDSIAGLGVEVTVNGLASESTTDVVVFPPYGPETLLEITADTNGIGNVWIPGADLELAGIYNVSIEGAKEQTFKVMPDSMDPEQSSIYISENTLKLNTGTVTATVILRDSFGNPISGRAVELISSRASDTVQALTKETDADGIQEFAISTGAEGELTLRAIDLLSGKVLEDEAHLFAGNMAQNIGGPYYASNTQRFYPDTNRFSANLLGGSNFRGQVSTFKQLEGFRIEIIGQENESMPQLNTNDFYSITITAIDQNGDRFLDYQNTVYLLSTDPDADLPKDGIIRFDFKDQGRKQFTLGMSFRTPSAEPHTLIITDHPSEVQNILGELEILVSGQTFSSPEQNIRILQPKNGLITNEKEIIVEGNAPPFINIIVEGGKNDIVEGETDRDGFFRISIELDESKTEHVLKARDKEGRYESEEVTIETDTTPPEAAAITFTPSSPEEETDVLLVIESEPNLQSITMTLAEEEYELQPSPTEGKYQVLFTAPTGGVYEPIITITDEIGNTAEIPTSLMVTLRGLAVVQNVVAEAQINAIALTWDPIETEVDAYRVYVGASPTEFLYTLDTDRPTAAATVAGLQPGATYYFAVTALQEERESATKSDVVQATVLGVKLEVTPQDGALLMEWASLQIGTPLSTFLLEYGTQPDTYTEQRTINGELRAFTLRDLLNGVTYYLKLTPVTTTGEKLVDLSATGQGVPIARSTGFHPSAADPAPFDIGSMQHAGAPRTPVPTKLSKEGIPMAIWIAIIGGVLFVFWHIRRRKEMQVTNEFLQEIQTQYQQNSLR